MTPIWALRSRVPGAEQRAYEDGRVVLPGVRSGQHDVRSEPAGGGG